MIVNHNIEKVNEQIHYTYRGILYRDHLSVKNDDWKPQVKIIRHPADDTFDIELTSSFRDTELRKVKPYIDIDHKVVIDSDVEYPTVVDHNGIKTYRINSNTLKNQKLKDSNTIVVALKDNYQTQLVFEIKISLMNLDKNRVNLSNGKVMQLLVTNCLTFQFRDMNNVMHAPEYIAKHIDNTVTNNYTYFVPRLVDRRNFITQVMDIYSTNNDEQKSIEDNTIEPFKRITTSIPKGLATNLNTKVNHKEKINVATENGTYEAHKVGTIEINQNTFYNYVKKQTEIGITNESQLGEIIPYSFKGTYTWTQLLNGYGLMHEFEISSSTLLNRPILNPDEGSVMLTIRKNTVDHLQEKYELSNDAIQRIKEIKVPTLITLKRLSDEKVI